MQIRSSIRICITMAVHPKFEVRDFLRTTMIKRLLKLTKKYSLFLFGARGVGKSTLVTSSFNPGAAIYFNLLDPKEEHRFAINPNELIEIVDTLADDVSHVIIDEIQKVPKLLDVVHLLLESRKRKRFFVLTGSSARKLKMSGVNLLAGRAFVYHLFPFTFQELGKNFQLVDALRYGMLPKVFEFKQDKEKELFLQSYALTYLKEEIWGEQLVKKLDPFRNFLEVAAQTNGKVINYLNIARDVGVDDKTVKNYFSILEDTLIAIILEPFKHSFRKRLREAPKFYFFDIGVARSLARMLNVSPKPGTSYYGELFECFIVPECIKLASYYHPDYKFSYLMTSSGVEIDLVVERPGKSKLLIEIKSSDHVHAEQLTSFQKIAADLGDCEAICLSNDKYQKKIGKITVYPWEKGLIKYLT